jgi:hypothetical protein
MPPNNGMQQTALRAAADAERSAEIIQRRGRDALLALGDRQGSTSTMTHIARPVATITMGR